MSSLDDKIATIKKHIKEYPDFPKPGIIFRDIFSVLQEPELFKLLNEVLVEVAAKIQPPVDCVVGVDSRGFLLAPLIALGLQVPFVPIRKKGKLPGNVASVTYSLEYGEDVLQIREESIKAGQRVLIVDDLLATGGSLGAASKLVQKMQGKVAACLVVIELTELKGRTNVPAEVISLVTY